MFMDTDIEAEDNQDFVNLLLEEEMYTSKGSEFTLQSIDEMATVNEVHVYGTIGILLEFKPDDDWTVYKERTEQYFLANMIPEEHLCDPLPPAQCTYAQLCTLLTIQFGPKISFFRKREELYSLLKDSHD
ncbi:Uncharacterized protein FWK35_00036045 [Aphis craccivora]|uniref:Uncharacterized protein n=1 Tax=Aphis craccivora TaxID=307492 RepID=A0A6G0YNW6_APHCR|nr:Uncharacterized protein FWK35_00036045 [Aphis craccivora]